MAAVSYSSPASVSGSQGMPSAGNAWPISVIPCVKAWTPESMETVAGSVHEAVLDARS